MLRELLSSKIYPILFICLLGGLIYFNTFQNDFVFDDTEFIVDNIAIRDITNLNAVWHVMPQPSRFVTFYTFALNYHFHQLDVFGYHFTNLMIHLFCALLVCWFVHLIFLTPRLKTHPAADYKTHIAFAVSLIFVSHPLQTQAVTYISQRFESLASLFYLASLCLYLGGRIKQKNIYFVGMFFSMILGMFTKEIVLTLPLMILFIEVFLVQQNIRDLKKFLNRHNTTLILITFVLPLLIIPAIFDFRIGTYLFKPQISQSHDGDIITFGGYFLSQFRVLTKFIQLFIFPIHQNLDYDFPISQHLFDGWTFPSVLFILAVLFLAFKLRNKYTIISFGLFWFFLVLSVNFIPRQNIIFEHKMYLPMVGLSLSLCMTLFYWLKNKTKFIQSVLIITSLLCVLTFQRNMIWRDNFSLWSDVVKKSPNKARSIVNLGNAYYHKKKYTKALQLFDQAITINPKYPESYIGKALVSTHYKNYREAVDHLTKALEVDPRNDKAYLNRGVVYRRLGNIDLALADYKSVLEYNPVMGPVYVNLGNIYGVTGEYDQAFTYFQQAKLFTPHLPEVYKSIGNVYELIGSYDLALKEYNQAISLSPKFIALYLNRANIFIKMNKFKEALKDYNYVLSLDAKNALTYAHRSKLYKIQGQYKLAMDDALRAKQLGVNIPVSYVESLAKKIESRQ